MRLYKSYNFKDKDPIIDILASALKDDGIDWKDLPEFSGVNYSTYWNWFMGGTYSPSTPALMATVRILPTSTQELFFRRLTSKLVVKGIRSWARVLKMAA